MFTAHRSAHGRGTLKNRLFTGLVLLLLSAAWLCGPILRVKAQALSLLYEENFDSGDVPDGWKLENSQVGGWWAEGGTLYGVNHVWAEYRQVEWGAGTYRLEFDLVELNPENGSVQVHVQHSDVGSYLIGLQRVDAEHINVYLERNIWNRDPQPLANTSRSNPIYTAGASYRVSIFFGDGNFRIYLNRQGTLPGRTLPVLTAQDQQPLPPGGISFESMGDSEVKVDNLAVYGPQPPGPAPQPPNPVPEMGQCFDEELQYANDFDDGTARDWVLERGWAVGNGALQGKGPYSAGYPQEWGDLTLFVIFSQPQGSSGLRINARKSDAGRYFVYASSKNIEINKQTGLSPGGQITNLDQVGFQVEPVARHTLALGVHGGDIQVTLDGQPQLEVTDDKPLPPGGIGFETLDNSSALIDAVWVCAPPVTVPPPDLGQLPDLQINAIQAQDFNSSSNTLELMVAVGNAGDAAAGASQIRVQGVDGEDGFYPVEVLAPGDETEITLWIQIPDRLLGQSARFDVVVDPNNQVREANEQNNGRTSAAIEFPAPPTPPGPEVNWPVIIGGGLLGVVLLYLVGRAIWRRPGRGREPEGPEEPRGLPPVLPPPRLLNLWLTEGSTGQGRLIDDSQPLVSGAEYCLHAQVGTFEPQRQNRTTSDLPPYALQAVVFSPETDFILQNRRTAMNLPPDGPGEPVFWPFRANQPGVRRARVCLYFGNLLLQSGYVDAAVVSQGSRDANARASTPGGLRRMLDYVASASLTGLMQFPQPSVSIFTNRAIGGAGWIGVYAAGDPITGFGDGLLRQVSEDHLSDRARVARQHLLEIEDAYNSAQLFPDSKSLESQGSRLEEDLAALACNGWTLYDELFLGAGGGTRQEKLRFDQALRPPGLVAIDRCRGDGTTLPWAMVYDLEVDTGKQDQLRLCPVIKSELAAHWSGDMTQYQAHPDWLDNPQGCRRNPRCPLGGEDALLTICPFGFWGFRHQISQPLQMVQPVPVGQIPGEFSQNGEDGPASSFDSTIFLQRRRDELLRLAIGVHPGLDQADRLPADINALSPGGLDITFKETRDQVLDLLQQGGFHLYVLYCHGDLDEGEQKFKLVFGPVNDERSISSDNLNPLRISWPQQPKPLVMLNGCETVAVTPEMVHGLLDRLHELGAAGVVGTEIKVYPSLAYPFGLDIVAGLLHGASLGETFLHERKELLRKFTPLGLAYTYYAPAGLHLHLEGNCAWCAAHQVPRPATEGVPSL